MNDEAGYCWNLLLADDDKDDCLIFKEALAELPIKFELSIVHNGEQLLQFLNTTALPDILFLDLNMPRRNGLECIIEIKKNDKLKNLPVVIYSTSFQEEKISQLYRQGAQFYIRKPNEISDLKLAIQEVLYCSAELDHLQPAREDFVLSYVLMS